MRCQFHQHHARWPKVVEHASDDGEQVILGVQAEVDQHLVVPRTTRVDLLSELAKLVHEPVFERAVDVLVLVGDREGAAPRIVERAAQCRAQRAQLRRRQQPDGGEPAGVRQRADDVPLDELPVPGSVVTGGVGRHLGRQRAAPQGRAHRRYSFATAA